MFVLVRAILCSFIFLVPKAPIFAGAMDLTTVKEEEPLLDSETSMEWLENLDIEKLLSNHNEFKQLVESLNSNELIQLARKIDHHEYQDRLQSQLIDAVSKMAVEMVALNVRNYIDSLNLDENAVLANQLFFVLKGHIRELTQRIDNEFVINEVRAEVYPIFTKQQSNIVIANTMTYKVLLYLYGLKIILNDSLKPHEPLDLGVAKYVSTEGLTTDFSNWKSLILIEAEKQKGSIWSFQISVLPIALAVNEIVSKTNLEQAEAVKKLLESKCAIPKTS